MARYLQRCLAEDQIASVSYGKVAYGTLRLSTRQLFAARALAHRMWRSYGSGVLIVEELVLGGVLPVRCNAGIIRLCNGSTGHEVLTIRPLTMVGPRRRLLVLVTSQDATYVIL